MKTLIIVLCVMLISVSIKAQEWTSEQKEVWENVETYWNLLAKGDIDGFLSYFHDDFSGWRINSPTPDDQNTRVKLIRFASPNTESLYYEIRPMAIKIHGNFAFVHYYYMDVYKQDENVQTVQGRWTDILIKQGDRWIMIGDHGGPDPVED